MSSKDKCIELAYEGERRCKSGDYIGAVKYFEAAVDQGTDDLTTLSAIYSQLGNAYVFIGDFIKAVQYHQHDRTLARTIGDLPGEAKASSNLANTLKMMGKYNEAIVCCQRHLDIARELSDKVGEAKALYSMANIYHVKAKQQCKATAGLSSQDPNAVTDLKISIKLYEQNLAVAEQLGDRAAQGRTCGSLGNTHYLLGNCNEAVKYHFERLAIAKEFGDKAAQRRAFTNLGNTHVILGEYQAAADFYLQTLSISRQLGDRAFEAQACYSLGSTYTLLGDYQRAIEYHLRHKQIAQELNDRIGVGRACWLLSNAHMSLENHKEALDFAKEQLQISTEIGDDAGKTTAQKNVEKIVGLLKVSGTSSNADLPRVRRLSMEKMELLRLTPEQAKAAEEASQQARKAANYGGKRLFRDNMRVDMRNGNHVEGYAKPANPSSSPELLNSNEGCENFFDLLSRLQCRRMDDQRAEMRADDDSSEEGLPQFLQRLAREQPAVNLEPGNHARNEADEDTEEHHEKMNDMISMLARSQSKRLNEQRVSLSCLPGLRINDSGEIALNAEGPANGAEPAAMREPEAANNNVQARSRPLSLDDNFFENLIRCQGTRLDDQRSPAPDLSGDPRLNSSTIPAEDFLSLIVRMQSSRIDDQRCRFEPDDQ